MENFDRSNEDTCETYSPKTRLCYGAGLAGFKLNFKCKMIWLKDAKFSKFSKFYKLSETTALIHEQGFKL